MQRDDRSLRGAGSSPSVGTKIVDDSPLNQPYRRWLLLRKLLSTSGITSPSDTDLVVLAWAGYICTDPVRRPKSRHLAEATKTKGLLELFREVE